jgi:hypothetical protein
MTDRYTALDQKPFVSDYTYTEQFIDHPVAEVWPYALDLPAWMSANHEWEPIAGERGEVGYFWRISPRRHYVASELPLAEPHYHVIGLSKVIEHKLIVVELFPEKGGSYGDRFMPADDRGFGPLMLTDLGERTCITALNIHTAAREPDQPHPDASMPDEVKAEGFAGHFDKLRRLVDGLPLEPPETESLLRAG